MKKFLSTIFLCAIAYAQLLDDKFVVLPKFEPKSQMTKEVKDFVDNATSLSNFIRKAKTTRDLLGRKTLDSTVYLVNQTNETRMKVIVTFVNIPKPLPERLFGRYETDSVSNKRYWINGKEVTESLYIKKHNEIKSIIKATSNTYQQPYIANLTAEEIKKLLEGPEIVTISKYIEPQPLSNDTTVNGMVYYKDSVIRVQSQIETWAFGNGYKGNGIGIYFTETGCPNLNYVNQSLYSQGNTCIHGTRTHPTGVARVLQTTAPQAMIYGFDQENRPNNPMNYSVPIYIGSHSWAISGDSLYTYEDKEMDNYIYNEGVIEFIASGNKNPSSPLRYVCSPGKSVNAITVGAIQPDTYTYAYYTQWKNSVVQNQKPEIPNFSHFYFEGDTPFSITINGVTETYNGTFNGTSASTPYTAAMAADVLSQHSFFKEHPEMFKALIMTGSTQNITSIAGSPLLDTDNYARIKKIPLYFRMGWNTRSAYWNGNNNDFFSSDSTISFTESNITAGKRYRIAIAWLSNGDYVYNYNLLPQDMDLYVYQNGNLIAQSISTTNPFELVDFTTQSPTDFTIVIKRSRNSYSDNILMGYNFLKIN